ncbi:MAG: DegV family protein [Lachnospiraceae bacterium]|nr:DegV family protein [Lachnospiraceae bacterium]
MDEKITIIADSTCDLSKEIIREYGIEIAPLCIVLDDRSYLDSVDITPEEIFRWAKARKTTPKTSAILPENTVELLRPHLEAGEDVLFFTISESMSSTCNVAKLAGSGFDTGRLFVIDSQNLSTGIGLQVLRACDLKASGLPAEEIAERIKADRDKVRASFVIDTLDYLAMGGRCSGMTALLGNALKLHPSIYVKDGKMSVGKKYRGRLERVITDYVKDLEKDLMKADKKRVFITHSGVSKDTVDRVYGYLASLDHFDDIIETLAGGVISCHCGPGTLGVLFYEE